MLRTHTLPSQVAPGSKDDERKEGEGTPVASGASSRRVEMREGAVVIAESPERVIPPGFDVHERPTVKRPVEPLLAPPKRPALQLVSRRPSRTHGVRPILSSMPPSYLPPVSLALGSLEEVPYVALDSTELRTRKLDPQAAFVLALLDGRMTIESVLDICPLGMHRVLRILGQLHTDGVIALRPRGASRP